jgi:hypothetical protein
MRKPKMQLTASEQQWLDAYRQALRNQFADAVEEVLKTRAFTLPIKEILS